MGKKKKMMEVQEMNIFLRVPENAAALEVNAVLIDGKGRPTRIRKNLSIQDIQKARKDFLKNVEDGDDYDARYVVND